MTTTTFQVGNFTTTIEETPGTFVTITTTNSAGEVHRVNCPKQALIEYVANNIRERRMTLLRQATAIEVLMGRVP